MIAATLAAAGAAGAAVWAWRRARLAAAPETWPSGLTFARQLSLTRSYLKQNGWEMMEPSPPLYIRAGKDGIGLSLVLHTEETLSLPTLVKDATDRFGTSGIILGILSQQTLDPAFQEDAARAGIYVINPADLRDVTTHIRRVVFRRKQIMDAAGAEKPQPVEDAFGARQVPLLIK